MRAKLENGMNKALRFWWRFMFGGRRARRRLSDALERLALYCQEPNPQAKEATDLYEAMKQWTWWPTEDLLKQIKESVLTLAGAQRKYPERRPWEAFELVNRRNPKPRLIKCIDELVERARERFTEAGFSDLETLEPEWSKAERFSDLEALSRKLSKDKDARNLLRDIDGIKENVSAARAIDWTQYRDILARLPGSAHLASGNDTALVCYARVLELIMDHRRWEKLRKESAALVFWLLEISHPRADELKRFNHGAVLRALYDEEVKIQREREAKLDNFQQSGRVIKKSKADIEDDRLMELVRQGNAQALEILRKRHQGLVKWKMNEILGENWAVDDIKVFAQVWYAARKYVATAKFTTWLIEIAKNLALNEKNRAKKEKERIDFAHVSEHSSRGTRKTESGGRVELVDWRGEDSSLEDSEGASETDHALPALREALSQLSPLQRRVIEGLYGIGGSKRKDRHALAMELGITASKVEEIENEAQSEIRELMSP
jgi:RNA polymerase sigma factor (sigma-70 family)